MLGAFKEDVLFLRLADLKKGQKFWSPLHGYGVMYDEVSEEHPQGSADYNQEEFKFDDVLKGVDSIFTNHHQAVAFYLEYYRGKKDD